MTAMKRSIVVDLVPAMSVFLLLYVAVDERASRCQGKTPGQQKGRHLPALLNKSSGLPYGPPKMSELPNVVAGDWQGTGAGKGMPLRNDAR
jgi:hypothetical protein